MAESSPSAEKIYEQLCQDIRVTDEISFKLLGFVPLISGAGITAIGLLKESVFFKPGFVTLLSLFAAAITLGLFRWELWNIKKCRLFIYFVDALEKKVRDEVKMKFERDFIPPNKIGKTGAEKLIYSVTILAWLVTPLVFLSDEEMSTGLVIVYTVFAISISVFTFVSLFAVKYPQAPNDYEIEIDRKTEMAKKKKIK